MLEPKLFDCNTCLNDYKKIDDTQRKKMLEKKQFGRGCSTVGICKYNVGNLQYNICVGNYYDSSINYIWDQFTLYENNLLPYKGTLGEQPNKIIEIFDIIQSLVREYEGKLRKIKRLKDQAQQRLGNGR